MSFDPPTETAKVCIRQEGGEWHVFVRTADGKQETSSFVTEKFALNFAEGQRIRIDQDERERCKVER